MIVGMFLEMLGIGLVVPALMLMTRSGAGTTAPWIVEVLDSLGNPSRENLVMYGMLALVGVYAVKSLFLAFLAWKQMQFVYGAQEDVSQRLFQTYLRQPYAFHLQRNSAQLISNAVNEVHVFSHVTLTSGLMLMTELLVLIGIASVLLVVEPVGALVVVATVGVLTGGFHFASKGAVLRWGSARQIHDERRIQHLQQGLGGAKDVLLLGREREFLQQYRAHNSGSARAGALEHTLLQMPRLGLELLAVIGLAILVFIMLGRGAAIETILPTLGLFAAAGFRMLPSVNRVMISGQNVRYALPVVSRLHEELALGIRPLADEPAPLRFERRLRFVDTGFSYAGSAQPALQQVNLEIRRGTTVGLIGDSGAGKSTLVDVLLGLLQANAGRVEVDDVDVASDNRAWQRNIGYVPQAIFLTDDTLRRNIAFGVAPDLIDETAIARALQAAQLDEYVASLPDGLDTMVGERGVRLSGGQLQRIGIARALYHDPPVLVLDEATSSLDTATERGVMRAVRALHGRKTIVIVAHRLSTLQDCDRIFRLEGGRIVAEGDAAEMIGAQVRAASGDDVFPLTHEANH
jgi:ATP-binding cassette, subfamily B, bacterial PglK